MGSHIVSHMMRFILRDHEDPPEEEGDEETEVLVPKEHEGKRFSLRDHQIEAQGSRPRWLQEPSDGAWSLTAPRLTS